MAIISTGDYKRVMFWMWHSLNLIEEKAKGKHIHKWDDRPDLEREAQVCRYVMDNIKQADRLGGSARVWWWWMVSHARLQVKRYGREMTDEEFYAACKSLRQRRDDADTKVSGQPWMKGIS